MKDLYTEEYRTSLKEIKDLSKCQGTLIHRLEE